MSGAGKQEGDGKKQKMKPQADALMRFLTGDVGSDDSDDSLDSPDAKDRPVRVHEGPIRVVVIGYGNRGQGYCRYALEAPMRMEIVGVAEPIEGKRARAAKMYELDPSSVFESWEAFAKSEAARLAKGGDRLGDAVIIATQDCDHVGPACACAELGYQILLEKPMAQSEKECVQICRAVEEHGVRLCVCHVMRYSQATRSVKKLLDSGVIGKVLHIQHLEPVGWYHYAHSYVRGNWHRQDVSSFILMTKSCHDIDLICYFMGDDPCVRVSSFGSLTYFNASNRPKGVPEDVDRCLDCPIEKDCIYSAVQMYVRQISSGWSRVLMVDGSGPTVPKVEKALREGPYGKCVYNNDNDVCDNQCVQMQFRNGASATFSLVATTQDTCKRKITIFGTLGEIRVNSSEVEHLDFGTRSRKVVSRFKMINTALEGHGYADYYLMRAFIDSLLYDDPKRLLTTSASTLRSHKLVYRAEQARKEDRVIRLDENIDEVGAKKAEEEVEEEGESAG